MALKVERFPPGAEAAAARCNARLRAGGVKDFEVPESPFSRQLPEGPDRIVWQQYFIALDERPGVETEVRGSYILQYRPYAIDGEVTRNAFLKLPVSEGIVDKKYALVGVQLMRDVMRRESNLCSSGMGGMKRPLPNLLLKLGWQVDEVPFYFRVLRPARFFRNARVLRHNPFRAAACDALAWSGAGWLGTRLLQLRPPGRLADAGVETRLEPEFGAWADEIWEHSRAKYFLVGQRNREVLEVLYPKQDPRWLRLHVLRAGKSIGWALMLCTDLSGHKQFGNMRLGSIADCMAAPGDARAVVGAATRFLEEKLADLIVSNQLHAAWGDALRRSGFLRGPSNYVFAMSPAFLETTGPVKDRWTQIHVNRGDGDGPINL